MIKWTRLGKYKSGKKTNKKTTYLLHAVFKPAVSLLKNAQTVAAITKGEKKGR